jgi:hypothetical protein
VTGAFSTASIYFWETDHCRPRAENLNALCKVLKLPIRMTQMRGRKAGQREHPGTLALMPIDNPQDKIGGRYHATLLKLPSAARQRSG